MARRSHHKSAPRTQIIRARPVAPIIRVSAPRAPAHHRKHHRRHSVGAAKVNQKTLMAAAVGGAVLGFVDKSFPTLPTIPILGRAGTIALAAWMLSGRGGIGAIARDVALAAASVAGYELGKEGKVSGEIMGATLAPQVSGIISQQV
jgi:hypothetical protein